MNEKLELWNSFCRRYVNHKSGIPLFETNGSQVNLKSYGKNDRLILKRSEEMENLLIEEVNLVLRDFENKSNTYEGLIYMMYTIRNQTIIPFYIGKSEKYGKRGDNLSLNIKNIEKNKSFFCRWGDNYAYHIGDLSAVVCPGHPENKIKRKYQRWANQLFEGYPTAEPVLNENVYFWIHAWQQGNVGIFPGFGATPLTALEYQLISVAATLFLDDLLNEEGVNRGRRSFWLIWLTFYSMGLSEYLVSSR